MKPCIVDYETYYDNETSVVNLGTPNYVKAADAYIVAASIGDEVHCGTIQEMGPVMEQIVKDPTVVCWSANANFDRAFSDKYHGPSANDWQCILDLGCFHQFPRNLAGLVKVALHREMDKTTRDEMKGVRYEELSDEGKIEVQEYCIGDVQDAAEVLATLKPMSATEEKIAAHTRMINRRGVYINTDLVDADKTKLEQFRFDSLKQIPWYQDAAPLSYQQLIKWCASKGIPAPKSTAKTDEECSDLMSEHPELNAVLGTMRKFRRSNTLLKKIEALTQRVTEDGRLALDLLYCGAPHTRRWSSRGFNVQNLDKEPFVTRTWDEIVDPADLNDPADHGSVKSHTESVWSRNWIVPPPGKQFLILDLSQIEPRCLNWLAGNEEMMEALRNGFSYYEAYVRAAKQEKRVGWTGTPGMLKKEVGIARYTKIKNESLGCGFGMGANKYMTYANVPQEEAEAVVRGFRLGNKKITDFWAKLDGLIVNACRDKSHHLAMEMPSGDLLQHFHIRSSGRGYESFTVKGDFSQQSRQPRLWGGTLTENVTQRMARDVLAEAALRLEGGGFPVMFHSHDEVILAVDEGVNKAEAKADAMHLFTKAPDWAPDLPLGCEGDFCMAYVK